MSNVIKIKNYIKSACDQSDCIPDWFFDEHLEVVDAYVEKLLEANPEANAEVVGLAVWLHDTQRIYGLPGEHALAGAQKAREILAEFNYPQETSDQVYEVIRTHRANSPETMPTSLEGKILATADALAHFSSSFYLKVLPYKTQKGDLKSVEEFKKWALDKIERDYQDKIFFEDTRELIKNKYQTLKAFFEME